MEPMEVTDNQPLTARILKGSSIVLFFTLATAPLGYFLRMILSRTLSIEMYGLYFAMISFFSFFVTYNDLGFGYSLSYYFPKFFRKKDYKTCWNLYTYDQLIELMTSVILSVILFISAPWIATHYFKVFEAEYLIKIFCVYFIANSIVSALHKLYNGMQQELYYSSMECIRFLFLVLITSIFYLSRVHDVSVYAWGLVSSYIFVAFIYRLLLQKNFNRLANQPFSWNPKRFRTMAAYALPTIMTTSVYTLVAFSDTFFLTLLKGVKEVGIYNIMTPIITVFAIFLSPINTFLFPFISHHADSDKNTINMLLYHTLRIIPFISLYFAIFIILFPNPIISILFGSKWSTSSAIALSILAIGYSLSTLGSFLATYIIGFGKVKERLRVSIFMAVINSICSLCLIPFFGIIGVAISYFISSSLSVFFQGKILASDLTIRYPIGFYIKIILFGSILFILTRSYNLFPNNWLQLILYGIIYTAIMGVFGLWIKVYPDLWKLLQKINIPS